MLGHYDKDKEQDKTRFSDKILNSLIICPLEAMLTVLKGVLRPVLDMG